MVKRLLHKKCLTTRGEFKEQKCFHLGIWQNVSLQRCKGSKSLLSGRFGYPYRRPGDSFCIRETPGLSGRVGMNAFELSNLRNMFITPISLKTCPGLSCTYSAQFQKKIPKISHCGLRSPKYLELGHFTLLLCRGQQRNAPRFKTHVHRHCSAH